MSRIQGSAIHAHFGEKAVVHIWGDFKLSAETLGDQATAENDSYGNTKISLTPLEEKPNGALLNKTNNSRVLWGSRTNPQDGGLSKASTE